MDEQVYEVARFVGLPGEILTRFAGALEACGYSIAKKDLLPEGANMPQTSKEVHDTLIDAERYRWLRDKMPRPLDGQATFWLRRGADLDEAVDAARLDCSPQTQAGSE